MSNHRVAPPIDSGYPWRVAGFSVATAAIYTGIAETVRHAPISAAAEGGTLENLQVASALTACVGFAVAARRTHFGRAALTVCAAALAYAAARELDTVFETYLFDDAYKYLVGLPAGVICVGVCWAARKDLVGETLAMLRHPAATLAAVSATYLLFVCQTFDRPLMWTAAGTQADVIKPVIEETAEVFAYLVIAYAALESWFMASASRRGDETPVQTVESPLRIDPATINDRHAA